VTTLQGNVPQTHLVVSKTEAGCRGQSGNDGHTRQIQRRVGRQQTTLSTGVVNQRTQDVRPELADTGKERVLFFKQN
jgi:hypothetical protein